VDASIQFIDEFIASDPGHPDHHQPAKKALEGY
jgi:hypothetical protein